MKVYVFGVGRVLKILDRKKRIFGGKGCYNEKYVLYFKNFLVFK